MGESSYVDHETNAGLPDRPKRWLLAAERVSDAYGLVLLLTLATYVVISLVPDSGWGRALGVATAGLTCIVALTSSEVPLPRVRQMVVLVSVTSVVAFVSVAFTSRFVIGAVIIIVSGLMLYSAGTILRRVLFSREVDFRTILGALSTYTMLGLLWGFLFMATNILEKGGLFGSGTSPDDGEILFFSYTTLTTTGYGNFVPAGQPGEMFSVFEMLTGQVFLVTLVAGLVSLWRPGARAEELGRPPVDSGFRHLAEEFREGLDERP